MTKAFSSNSSEPAKPRMRQPLVRQPGLPDKDKRSARDIAIAQNIPAHGAAYKVEDLGLDIAAQD